jgi:DNA-binding CsgD family transcriptional regulator
VGNTEFSEAAEFWELERLFTDLSTTKTLSERSSGKPLTKTEKLYLRGILAQCSPKEVAARCQVSEVTVRSYLSDRIYPYVKSLALEKTGTEPDINHWSKVAPALEQLGYKRRLLSAETQDPEDIQGMASGWAGAPEVEALFGRKAEMDNLQRWLTEDQRRIIHLTGAEGIGKTALTVELAKTLENEQNYAVLWVSMAAAPSLEKLLEKIQRLWGLPVCGGASTLEESLVNLINELSKFPWIVVLDAMEHVIEQGKFMAPYRDYTKLFGQLCRLEHRGCVVVTSSEKLNNLSILEDRGSPVKSLRLEGLDAAATRELLEHLQVNCEDPKALKQVKQTYGGNPQFLRLLAGNVCDVFGGQLTTFTQLNTVFLDQPMQDLVGSQWQRLSFEEQTIASRLAAVDLPLSARDLKEQLNGNMTGSDLVNGLQRLRERALISLVMGNTNNEPQYELQSVVRKYLSDYLDLP